MKRYQHLRRQLAVVVGMAAVALPGVAAAASQGYGVLNNSVRNGMLVSQTANAGVVDLATGQTAAQLLGVVAPASGTSLTAQPGQINVENDGEVSTLVSTLGGDVRVGDRIAPSALAGVGAKLSGNGWIVGVAQASLDRQTAGAVATQISDTKGGKHTVYVAPIAVVLHVTYYSQASTPDSTVVPGTIQTIADKIAGKRVSLIGLLLSFILLVTGIVWAGQLLHAAIAGSMDAISRQPLARRVINRALWRSLSIAAVIVFGVVFGAWLLLRFL